MTGTLWEVRRLLKRFHIYIYSGNDVDDAVLMELELDDLQQMKLIEDHEYVRAKMILRQKMNTSQQQEGLP